MAKPQIYERGTHIRVTHNNDVLDVATGELVPQLSRTKQEFKEDCDIAGMLDRFTKTGRLNIMRDQPKYMDLTQLPSFQESMEQIADVNTAFRLLPADTRADFDNDESQFVTWVLDPNNHAEARDMGLLPDLEGGRSPSPTDPETPISEPDSEAAPPSETPPVTGGE